MEKYIKQLQSKSLSNEEIMKALDNKANLIIYPELYKYKTLDDVLGKWGKCIILFETQKNYGHWCCIFKLKNRGIEFFDSYGNMVDTQLKKIDINFRIENNEFYPHLSLLMLQSPYLLSYNHFKFQELKKNVNSCGRWCVLRLLFSNLTLDEFIKIFGKKREFPNDFYATLLTIKI